MILGGMAGSFLFGVFAGYGICKWTTRPNIVRNWFLWVIVDYWLLIIDYGWIVGIFGGWVYAGGCGCGCMCGEFGVQTVCKSRKKLTRLQWIEQTLKKTILTENTPNTPILLLITKSKNKKLNK